MANTTPIKKTVTTETNAFGWFDFFGLKRANVTPGVLGGESFADYAINALNSQGYHEASISMPTDKGMIPKAFHRYVAEAQMAGLTPLVLLEKHTGVMDISGVNSYQELLDREFAGVSMLEHYSKGGDYRVVTVTPEESRSNELSDLIFEWNQLHNNNENSRSFFWNDLVNNSGDLTPVCEAFANGEAKNQFAIYVFKDGKMVAGSINSIDEPGKSIIEKYRAVDPSAETRVGTNNLLTDVLLKTVFDDFRMVDEISYGEKTARYGHHQPFSPLNYLNAFEMKPVSNPCGDYGLRVVVPSIDFSAQHEWKGLGKTPVFFGGALMYVGVPLDQMHLPVDQAEIVAHVIAQDYDAIKFKETFPDDMHRKGISRVNIYSQQEPGVLKLENMKYFPKK